MMNNPGREAPPPLEGGLSAMLAAARSGTDSEVGQLFEATRRYLLMVANRSLDQRLHQKVAPSDLVQETFVDAHRDFDRFAGKSEGELYAWLRQIVLHKAADAGRKYRDTAKRDIARERPIAGSSKLGIQIVAREPTPSALAMGNENEVILAEAMRQLPADYREVIELRSLQRLPFAQVGEQMGRSEDSVGKLWFRAIRKLRDELAVSNGSGLAFSR